MARPIAPLSEGRTGYLFNVEAAEFVGFRRGLLEVFSGQQIRDMTNKAFRPAGRVLVKALRQASPRRTGKLRRSFVYRIQHRLDRTRGGATAIGSQNVSTLDGRPRYSTGADGRIYIDRGRQTGQSILLAGTTTKGGKHGWKFGFVNTGTKKRSARNYRDERGRWKPLAIPANRGRIAPQLIAVRATNAKGVEAMNTYRSAFVGLADKALARVAARQRRR